ncbi:MAG: universal stress protein [Acidobacteriota bacterium]
MFRKILVPIDGSDYSDNAARVAAQIAEKFQSEITLLHVVNRSLVNVACPPEALPTITDAVLKEWHASGERILQETLELIDNGTSHIETLAVWGNPAEVIIEQSRSAGYDLIVMGCLGIGAFTELLIGSVSNRVSHLACCPVMLVKAI